MFSEVGSGFITIVSILRHDYELIKLIFYKKGVTTIVGLEYSMRATSRKATNLATCTSPNNGDVFPHCSRLHAFCTKKIPSDQGITQR